MDNNTPSRACKHALPGSGRTHDPAHCPKPQNALVAGHEAGAQNWAVLASLIETCKLNGIEPHGYLTGVLMAIVNGHKQSDIDDLMPWSYARIK